MREAWRNLSRHVSPSALQHRSGDSLGIPGPMRCGRLSMFCGYVRCPNPHRTGDARRLSIVNRFRQRDPRAGHHRTGSARTARIPAGRKPSGGGRRPIASRGQVGRVRLPGDHARPDRGTAATSATTTPYPNELVIIRRAAARQHGPLDDHLATFRARRFQRTRFTPAQDTQGGTGRAHHRTGNRQALYARAGTAVGVWWAFSSDRGPSRQ